MVRQVIAKLRTGWPAALLVIVAGGAVLWHVLACTESPMAYSPSGNDLAFVTVEPSYLPYDEPEDLPFAGPRAYRLMVVTGQKDLRVVEQTTEHMLAAPAYTPDGRFLAYLRIPLQTPQGLEALEEAYKSRLKQIEEALSPPPLHWSAREQEPGGEKQPASPPAGITADSSLPPLFQSFDFLKSASAAPLVRACLVMRDAQTDRLVSERPVEFPLPVDQGVGLRFHQLYSTTRLLISPDGRNVYLCLGDMLLGLAGDREQTIFAAPVSDASMSGDGKVIAVVHRAGIGFVQPDGSKAVYCRLELEGLARDGMGWVDNQTVAMLRQRTPEGKEAMEYAMELIRTDGTALKPIRLELPQDLFRETFTGELAFSPNGRNMVITYGKDVFFMTAAGKVLRHWHSDEQVMHQPAFSPDSSRVALKRMEQLKDADGIRVSAIVFFSPEGKEVGAVDVPPVPASTTRPASQPPAAEAK